MNDLNKYTYTIMLLRPDYFADEYGKDIYTTYSYAVDVETAIKEAKRECALADACGVDADETDRDSFKRYMDDLYVIAVIKGRAEFEPIDLDE